MKSDIPFTFGTGTSIIVKRCQICDSPDLESILFLGYLPPVNRMHFIGERPQEETTYPAELLYCHHCRLVQLGLIVDAKVLFPFSYPYTSSTTKILRENFAELYEEAKSLIPLGPNDLIVDIGSNDGNLLSNFRDRHRVLGVTPEEIGKIAIERGIPTLLDYLSDRVVDQILREDGQAKLVTATNVFAHIENINDATELILRLLSPEGVFISESHYLKALIETLQYDAIYHEHLRYYSLHSLVYLFEQRGLEVFHAKPIPTHGGSIRVYASRKGVYPVQDTVAKLLNDEENFFMNQNGFHKFRKRVIESKFKLLTILQAIKSKGQSIYGISAPSRASTLIHYVGIDDGILDGVCEIKGSHKIGKYVPGTLIPIFDEERLFTESPDFALLLSWHIADELIPKLTGKGFKGRFIVPLPEPRVV